MSMPKPIAESTWEGGLEYYDSSIYQTEFQSFVNEETKSTRQTNFSELDPITQERHFLNNINFLLPGGGTRMMMEGTEGLEHTEVESMGGGEDMGDEDVLAEIEHHKQIFAAVDIFLKEHPQYTKEFIIECLAGEFSKAPKQIDFLRELFIYLRAEGFPVSELRG